MVYSVKYMKRLIFLFVFSFSVLVGFAQQAVQPDATFAGSVWYSMVDDKPNHDTFIRFDPEVGICTVGFMGGGKASEIYDFIYNKNDKNELLLCNLDTPMRPVVILTIHDNNTLEFNLVDLPVGTLYKRISYSEIK